MKFSPYRVLLALAIVGLLAGLVSGCASTKRVDAFRTGPVQCTAKGAIFQCSAAPLSAAWTLRYKIQGQDTAYQAGGTTFTYYVPRKGWGSIEAVGNGWGVEFWVRFKRGQVEFTTVRPH